MHKKHWCCIFCSIRQTSGWNCCSVLVWQYWHPSAPSHLLGSPHSSLCFTAGHGNALWQSKASTQQHLITTKLLKKIQKCFFSLTVWCNTCICACVGCASCPCCCGSTDRHNLDGTGEAAFYRALFCSGTARSFGLGMTRQKPSATVRPENSETVDTEWLSEFCIRRWLIQLLPPRGIFQGAFHTWKAKVDDNLLGNG